MTQLDITHRRIILISSSFRLDICLPNALISTLSYNPTVDVLAAGAVGRGAFVLYDVTSNFPQALTLQFGLANNSSIPDASILTDGTALDGMHFVRPLAKYGTGALTIAGDA
jgi:hypothetical protein